MGDGAIRKTPFWIWYGALSIVTPFLLLPMEYWYVYHHAPDSVCSPTDGLANQKAHLDGAFNVLLLASAIFLAAPGAILLSVGGFRNLIIRFTLPPAILVLTAYLLVIEGRFLSNVWPNPVFPNDVASR